MFLKCQNILQAQILDHQNIIKINNLHKFKHKFYTENNKMINLY